MSKEVDSKKYYITYNELMKLSESDHEEFEYQELCVYWLLFYGLNEKEIRELEVAHIKDNYIKTCRRDKFEVNDYLKIIIDMASKQTKIRVIGNGGKMHERNLKNLKYLIRSHNQGKDIPVASLHEKIEKLKKYTSKSKLTATNLSKSGMIYYAANILKSNNDISTYDDLKNTIYKPICNLYNKKINTFRPTLDELIKESDMITDFYAIEIPENLKRLRNKSELKRLPQKRNDDKKKSWQRDKENGNSGEELVENWLNVKFGERCAYRVEDFYGYDIYFQKDYINKLIEVKTMTNKKCAISITKNEYMTATKKKNYWFYIVVWNQKAKESIPELYIFKDLLELLNLKDKKDIIFPHKQIKGYANSIWYYKEFSIVLNECFFKSADEIYIIE